MAPNHMKLHIPAHVMAHADRVRAARGLHEDRTELLRQATTIGLLLLAASAPPDEALSAAERTWTAHHVYPHTMAAVRFLTAQGLTPPTLHAPVAVPPAPPPVDDAPDADDDAAPTGGGFTQDMLLADTGIALE